MSKLKLITFDLDNTLWPVDEVIRRAEHHCIQWVRDNHPDVAELMSTQKVRAIRDQLLQQKPGYLHNLTALRREAMAQAFREAGYPTQHAAKAAEEAFEVFHEARNQVVFFPGALELLSALADTYMLGALSNGNADLKKIGIDDLFAFHHSAETVGKRKPAPDMFLAALKSARTGPDRALHVGDHPREDVHAARETGLHAIWANLLDTQWPDDLPGHPHRIHNLHEITDLLPLIDD